MAGGELAPGPRGPLDSALQRQRQEQEPAWACACPGFCDSFRGPGQGPCT